MARNQPEWPGIVSGDAMCKAGHCQLDLCKESLAQSEISGDAMCKAEYCQLDLCRESFYESAHLLLASVLQKSQACLNGTLLIENPCTRMRTVNSKKN